MQGYLLIDKPSGWTSFDVVNYIRRIIANVEGKKPKNVKVGHTGTLDPLATGLLVILVGKEYTRRAESLTKLDKRYQVELMLGETSTTADAEGEKTKVSDRVPTYAEIAELMPRYTGTITQVPPVYSAIKVNGQRAYALARKGEMVELQPRAVTIYSFELNEYVYPAVSFTCDVSSGTYIRSLAEDMGKDLGVGAYMSRLRRLTVGTFMINDAVSPESLAANTIAEQLRTL